MSYFLIEYLEQRVAACDQMIRSAPDAGSLRIYEATRRRYLRDIEQLKGEMAKAVP